MNILIQGAVHALGYHEDGIYNREPDCYETIRDLIRYLREDGDDYTARIECGRHNLVEHDLVPMVKCDDLTDEEFDISIRLMVNLCQPVIATMRGKPPADRNQWKMYWELEENLRRTKNAFTDPHFFASVKKRVDIYFIDTEYEDRDERLRLVVERIVLLIKYIFSINQDTSESRRTNIDDSNHDRVILAFLQSGLDKTLMHIANQPREKEFHVTILDIFALLLKEQSAENLSKSPETEVSNAEKKQTEDEFRKIIENHVVRETQKRKSFSRFGGSYVIKGLKGISGNSNQVVFKPINNVEEHNFLDERKTKKRIARNRRPFEIDTNTHFASSEVRSMLRDVVIRLIETCFNRLMRSARSIVFVQGHVLHKTSQINYFFLVKFILRFVRLSNQHKLLERISECTGVEVFHENNVQLTEYVENATTLKGVEAKAFGLKAQYALAAYNELVLLHRYIYENSKEESEKKYAKRALDHIVNVEEYRDLPISIMKKFSSSVLSNNFLRELVLTTHHYIKLVERFVKSGVLKKVSKKVKVRKQKKNTKKQMMSEEDDRSEFDNMDKEALDNLWLESKEEILKILNGEIPEMKDMNPVVLQFDVSEENQQKFAKLSIQRSLRFGGFSAAVGLYHASKNLWVKSEVFKSTETVDDKLEELESILKADLRSVAKELKKAETKMRKFKLSVEDEQTQYDKLPKSKLQEIWDASKDQLVKILNHEIPEMEDMNPLNWKLEVPVETQQKFAMLAIQRSLRAKELPAAVGMYHVSRKLWPEDNIFGAPEISPKDELDELQGILTTDLQEVAKELKEAELVANKKLDLNDGANHEDFLDDEGENSEDEDEVPAWKVEEVDFQFDYYVTKFANVDVLKWYLFLLKDFSKNTSELNQALVKMLHRIAFDLKLPIKLYQVSLFQIFQKVNEHLTHLTKELRKSSPFYELYQFGYHLLNKFFVKYAEMGEPLAIEALFWKGPKECFEIENGYGSWIKNKEADIRVWTEDLETEVRHLYDEYKTMETKDGIDVLDFIEHNLSHARTRKQIAKKLFEFGLDLFGAKWRNTNKACMDAVLPIGDIRKWYEEWKDAGSEGDVVDVLQEKLQESLGTEVSRKKIIKQLAHMDIMYEKRKKEKPLPQWDSGLVEELKRLKEQYEEIDDAENILGVDIVRYVIKRLSEKKPTRQVERYLISMGANIVERSKKPTRKSQNYSKKLSAVGFLNDDSENELNGGVSEEEEDLNDIVMKSQTPEKSGILARKRAMLDSDDEETDVTVETVDKLEKPTKSSEKIVNSPEKASEKSAEVTGKPLELPKTTMKNTLMGLIANKKRKLAQLDSSDSDSSDSENDRATGKNNEKKTSSDSDENDIRDDADIYKRSSMDSFWTSGSVAGAVVRSERSGTSEEREEDDEDAFRRKIKFKRRIVMSDNEDEEN